MTPPSPADRADLVKRLRYYASDDAFYTEAAEMLEADQARIKELETALAALRAIREAELAARTEGQ